jgi:hypothetical protein
MTDRRRGPLAAYLLVAIFGLLALSGCTSSSGKDFARPDAASLVLGQTTVADIVAKIGAPTSRNVQHSLNPASSVQGSAVSNSGFRLSPVPGTIETLTYSYNYGQTPMVYSGPTSKNARKLELTFWNDHLVYYSFESSFDVDSTDFDESKFDSLVQGQTTVSDVINLVGRPTGEAIYPSGPKQGTKQLIYRYLKRDTKGWIVGPRETSITRKTARLTFDASDKLIEHELRASFSGT